MPTSMTEANNPKPPIGFWSKAHRLSILMTRCRRLVVAMVALAPAAVSAQDNLTAQEPDEAALVSRAVEVCGADDTLVQCPNACVTACRSVEFMIENTDGCEAAIGSPPGADDASCPAIEAPKLESIEAPKLESIEAPELESLAECIKQSRTIQREPPPYFTRTSERKEHFRAFFADQPECAASASALEAMFECLGGGTNVLKSEFETLGSLNLGDTPPSVEELRDLACSLEEDRLEEIDIEASDLISRAEVLSDSLSEVASCRSAYAQWFDARGDYCQNPDLGFDYCEQFVTYIQDKLEKALSGAAEQNRSMRDIIEQLKRDTGSLASLSLFSQDCR